jgi:HEAT repeats/PBS lyase HEAT-like repeat
MFCTSAPWTADTGPSFSTILGCRKLPSRRSASFDSVPGPLFPVEETTVSHRPISCRLVTAPLNRVIAIGLPLLATLPFCGGCAEGPLWRTGRIFPRVVQRWEQEEQIANSVFERKEQMASLVTEAQGNAGAGLDRAARELSQIALSDPILINRMEAIRQLGNLDCPAAWDALRRAINDPDPQVRLVVVRSWTRMSASQAVPALSAAFAADADVDVRLAAVRALGSFPGEASVRALAPALRNADPAIQLRATEALAQATGESFGPDVQAWSHYVNQTVGPAASAEPVRQAAQSGPASTERR